MNWSSSNDSLCSSTKGLEETALSNVKLVGKKKFHAIVSSNVCHHANKAKENKVDLRKSRWSGTQKGHIPKDSKK